MHSGVLKGSAASGIRVRMMTVNICSVIYVALMEGVWNVARRRKKTDFVVFFFIDRGQPVVS